MKKIVLLLASGLYSGYFPIVPGTFGTIPAWIIAWFLFSNQYIVVAATLVCFVLSVWSAGRAEEFLGHDSKKIVIDEWAGMFISLLFLPHNLVVYIFAFFLFRFYDVIKPYPAGRLENLPRGWGVTMDDVFAGIYANLNCWAFILLLKYLGWFGFEKII